MDYEYRILDLLQAEYVEADSSQIQGKTNDEFVNLVYSIQQYSMGRKKFENLCSAFVYSKIL